MCNFYSCIVTKAGNVLEEPRVKNHEAIIELHKLKDDKLVNRTWARIELEPEDLLENLKKFNKKDWKFIIDEPKTIDWINDKHEKACYAALERWIKKNVYKETSRRTKENIISLKTILGLIEMIEYEIGERDEKAVKNHLHSLKKIFLRMGR